MEEIGSFVSIIRTDEARIEGIIVKVDLSNQRVAVKNGKYLHAWFFYDLCIFLETLLLRSSSNDISCFIACSARNFGSEGRKLRGAQIPPSLLLHGCITLGSRQIKVRFLETSIQRTRKTYELRFDLRLSVPCFRTWRSFCFHLRRETSHLFLSAGLEQGTRWMDLPTPRSLRGRRTRVLIKPSLIRWGY